MCEPQNLYGSYSTGITPDKNSNKTTSSKPRSKLKGDTLKKWESTLNLCVHAHGYDVELLKKASCNDSYLLCLNSSATMIGFLVIMVMTMIFPFDSISQATWST